MIALSTRSRCDLCDRPAVLEAGDVFLCERCDQKIHGAVENSDSCPSREHGYAAAANPPPAHATAATFSKIACEAMACPQAPGPSPVTGMSVDRSNAGGEHEEVAPRLIGTDEKSATCEITSLIAADEIVNTRRTGTGPGTSGPERDFFGATNPVAKATKGKAGAAGVNDPVRRSPAGTGLRVGEGDAVRPATTEVMVVTGGESAATNSNSGDVLGNLKPGSHTWGGDTVATAPSGRADESAISPHVAGCLSCGSFESLSDPPTGGVQLRAASLDMPGPQDSITNPDAVSSLPVMDASANCAPVTDVPAGAPFSSVDPSPAGVDLEAAVTDLEIEWARHGFRLGKIPSTPKYIRTFAIDAASVTASADNSKSVPEA